jgi:hypothetical protein
MPIASTRTLCARLILLVLAVLPQHALAQGTTAATKKPDANVAPAKAETESTLSLAEILTEMEDLEGGERRLRQLLADDQRLPGLAAEVDAAERAFSDARTRAGSVEKDLVGFHQLVDLSSELRAVDQSLATARNELVSRAKALDAARDRVAAVVAKTGEWVKVAEKRDASPALRARIQASIVRQQALGQELLERRDRVLEVLARATRLNGTMNALRIEVGDRRARLTSGLRNERGEPIWRVESQPGEWERVSQFFDAQVAQSFRHVRDHALTLLLIAFVAFALTYWLIVATREQLAAQAVTDSYTRRTVNLFAVPGVTASMVALLAVNGLGPQGPFNYHIILLALLPLPGVRLVRAAVGPHISLSLYTLAGVVISQVLLGTLLDPLPLASRLLLIAQCIAMGVALGLDLARGRLEQVFTGRPALVRWVAAGAITCWQWPSWRRSPAISARRGSSAIS